MAKQGTTVPTASSPAVRSGGALANKKDHLRPKAGHNGPRLRPQSLRSSSAHRGRCPARLTEIRFEGLVGLIPPLSYSLPLRTGRRIQLSELV